MRATHQYRLLAHLFYDRVGVLFYCKEREKIRERNSTVDYKGEKIGKSQRDMLDLSYGNKGRIPSAITL